MAAPRAGQDSATARKAMIDCQLRVSGVNEEFVLKEMARVPREDFVPESARPLAYIDRAVPLGAGRFLAAPLFHGRMLSEARLTAEDSVLVVDGGSGYLPELIRPLARAVEVIDPATATAKGRRKGDFSVLLIDGAVEQLPDGLVARLAEGGRVVTGVVARGVTRLCVGRKAAGQLALLPIAEMGIPVLPEFAKPKEWSF